MSYALDYRTRTGVEYTPPIFLKRLQGADAVPRLTNVRNSQKIYSRTYIKGKTVWRNCRKWSILATSYDPYSAIVVKRSKSNKF